MEAMKDLGEEDGRRCSVCEVARIAGDGSHCSLPLHSAKVPNPNTIPQPKTNLSSSSLMV